MDKVPDKLIKKNVDKFARDFINNLNKGEIDSCYNKIEETYQNDSLLIGLKNMHELLKDKAQINSRIISYKFSKTHSISNGNDFNTFSIEYEYQYSTDRWAYYSFILLEENNQYKVISFNFLPTYKSLDNIHDFTLKGKSFFHYLWLTLMILIPIFIILTIIFIIRTPLKYKWLWILLVIFGVVKFQLNWTTGEFDYQLLNFTLFGVGFVKWGVIAPWILSFSLPLVAIIFWFKRKSFIKKHHERIEEIEKLGEQIAENKTDSLDSETELNKEETEQETPEKVLLRLKNREDANYINFNILETLSPAKVLKFERILTNIKPHEKICYHDNKLKLIDIERWNGLVKSGNSESFKIIYSHPGT